MLNLGDHMWRVVHAEPSCRDEYEVTRVLQLLTQHLQKYIPCCLAVAARARSDSETKRS